MAINNRLAIAAASLAALAVCGGCQQSAVASQAPAQAAVQQDPHNPLIGQWRFVGIGTGPASSPSGCSIDMTFTPTQWTQTQAGATTTGNVTYIPGPSTVYVVDPVGDHVTYNLIDQSHIALDSFAPCTYVRVA